MSGTPEPAQPKLALANPPIVEAVIEFRGAASQGWVKDRVIQVTDEATPEYTERAESHDFQFSFMFKMKEAAEGRPPIEPAPESPGTWNGVRLSTADKLQIATFTKTNFTFSRLKPYNGWEEFHAEALRLFDVWNSLAQLKTIDRIGVRFVNAMPVSPSLLGSVFEGLCHPPLTFPVSSFLHRDLFSVPNEPYQVTIVRTFRPRTPPDAGGIEVLLDIDVFTTSVPVDGDALPGRLERMREIKNTAFRSCLTATAMELFK